MVTDIGWPLRDRNMFDKVRQTENFMLNTFEHRPHNYLNMISPRTDNARRFIGPKFKNSTVRVIFKFDESLTISITPKELPAY
jgi:hypothetical protein